MEILTKNWVLMFLVFSVTFLLQVTLSSSDQRNGGSSSSRNKNKVKLNELSDIKEWKKLIKSKTNVLILFVVDRQSASETFKTLQEVAELVQGIGTLVFADCTTGDGKKLCKKVKANPTKEGAPVLKHYHNGEFNKDYDRADKVSAIVNFMKDPTGDLPWEEDPTSTDILHLPDLSALAKTVKRESSGKGVMIMFYAPWCDYCKRMKPDYAAAATELKDESILAVIDVSRGENSAVRTKYNITGFPTLLYFRNGGKKSQYEGENNKDGIVSFMRNPNAPPIEKPKEIQWSDEPSEVIHLTSDSFDPFLKDHAAEPILIMFYAPWCGYCKKMKPAYTDAAQKMKDSQISGYLTALDATQETSIASRFGISSYPTFKFFQNGTFAFDVSSLRDEDGILEFMKDPNEPPPPPPPEVPWSEEESAVQHLTEENFKSVLKRKKHALIMFYAPWCGHCKQVKPELIAAAEENKDDPKVMFGAVDCMTNKPLCLSYGVQSFPTFKHFQYFNKEEVKQYDGPRTKTDLSNEVKGVQGHHTTYTDWQGIPGEENVHKLTDENMVAFLKNHESVLLMFYAPWCGHCKAMKPDYARAAISLARDIPSATLAAIDCAQYPRVLERYQIQGYPTIKYYRYGSLFGEYVRGRRAGDVIAFMTSPPTRKDEL